MKSYRSYEWTLARRLADNEGIRKIMWELRVKSTRLAQTTSGKMQNQGARAVPNGSPKVVAKKCKNFREPAPIFLRREDCTELFVRLEMTQQVLACHSHRVGDLVRAQFIGCFALVGSLFQATHVATLQEMMVTMWKTTVPRAAFADGDVGEFGVHPERFTVNEPLHRHWRLAGHDAEKAHGPASVDCCDVSLVAASRASLHIWRR